jgi:hypothetical protein
VSLEQSTNGPHSEPKKMQTMHSKTTNSKYISILSSINGCGFQKTLLFRTAIQISKDIWHSQYNKFGNS